MNQSFFSRLLTATKGLFRRSSERPALGRDTGETDEELIASVKREMEEMKGAMSGFEDGVGEFDNVMAEMFTAAEDPTLSDKDRAALTKIIQEGVEGFQTFTDEFLAKQNDLDAELREINKRWDADMAEVKAILARKRAQPEEPRSGGGPATGSSQA